MNFKIRNLTNKYYAVPNGNIWQVCKPVGASTIPNAFSGVPAGFTFTVSGLSGYVNPSNEDEGVPPGTQFPSVGVSPIFSSQSIDGVVSLDQFANDFTQTTILPIEETETFSDGVSVTIIPPVIGRNELIKIKISGLPTGATYKILNSTGFGILVKDGTNWRKAYHVPETVSDNNGRFGFDDANPFYVAMPNDIVVGKHLLNITIVQQTVSSGGIVLATIIYKIYNKTFIINQPPIVAKLDPYSINPEKFLCFESSNEGATGTDAALKTGIIAECCGPSYSYCLNQNKNLSRISGGPTGLLKDYYGSNNRNNVYRRAFIESSIPNSIKVIRVLDLPIRNWNIYDNLEFDIFLAGSRTLNLSINWTPANNNPKTRSFDNPVLPYSTTGDELNRWHHIIIPIPQNIKSGKVNRITLYVNQKQLTDELGEYDLNAFTPFCKTSTGCKRIIINNNYYLNLIGLDRIFLSNSETNFCTSSYAPYHGVSEVGKWTDEFDSTGLGAEEACNNVASYGWTGTRCCGDDLGETYNDINGGCWMGMFVANNSVAPVNLEP
ncbi:MAG: hypothetical protein AABW88_04405 [Nanoarchaeota archaeon]